MKSLAINGGAGRMGQMLTEGLLGDGFTIAYLVDVHEPSQLFGATYATSWDTVDASKVDVVVDFSSPDGVVSAAQWCSTNGVALVVGTTGLTVAQRGEVEQASTTVGVVIASNYSIGAVLSEKFAAMAAPYFDRVEIIEMHHDKKADAPSGTSIAAAQAIANAREVAHMEPMVDPTVRHTHAGARGAETVGGIKIHSVRLPGLVSHQEILFGGPGEGLTIRHDSFDRVSFVQGVALAAHAVNANPQLIDGIDSLI
jgi:4-hydroxy-tetrahydrodipicolinate reductase